MTGRHIHGFFDMRPNATPSPSGSENNSVSKNTANARSVPESEVKVLVYQHIEPAQFGIMGQERVNVLNLNLGLDELKRIGH